MRDYCIANEQLIVCMQSAYFANERNTNSKMIIVELRKHARLQACVSNPA